MTINLEREFASALSLFMCVKTAYHPASNNNNGIRRGLDEQMNYICVPNGNAYDNLDKTNRALLSWERLIEQINHVIF